MRVGLLLGKVDYLEEAVQELGSKVKWNNPARKQGARRSSRHLCPVLVGGEREEAGIGGTVVYGAVGTVS